MNTRDQVRAAEAVLASAKADHDRAVHRHVYRTHGSARRDVEVAREDLFDWVCAWLEAHGHEDLAAQLVADACEG